MEYTLNALREQVMTARATDACLLITGGASKAFYGNPPDADAARRCTRLDVSAHRGVIDYQPSELVLTARTGTRLAEMDAVLAEHGQMLAFEPPHFGSAATLGGCIASGLGGPRRVAAGGVRDYVLGARLLDSEGRVLRFGGEVMKNVAGYDVSRLLAGSLGIFGVLLDVSLKVVPRPACERTLRLAASQARALTLWAQWRAQPLPISASAWVPDVVSDGTENAWHEEQGQLWLRVSGSEAAVAAGCEALAAGLGHEAAGLVSVPETDAEAFWLSLREQRLPFFQGRPLWRLAVPPTTAPLKLGPTLIEWGGGQRWLAGGTQNAGVHAQRLRQAAAQVGGHATWFRGAGHGPDGGEHRAAPADGVFHPLAAGPATIARNLKKEFDPTGLFNPGRLIPGL